MSVCLSVCLSPSVPVPSPFSLPSRLLSQSLHPPLPSTSLRPSVATSIPSSLSLLLSFSHLYMPPSLCLSYSFSLFVPASPFSSFSLCLNPLTTRCPLSSFNKLINDISLARCISLWFVFGFSFAWTIVLISVSFSET